MKGLLDFFVFTIEQVINMRFFKTAKIRHKTYKPWIASGLSDKFYKRWLTTHITDFEIA